MPFGIGPVELGLVAGIAVLLFGAKKVPELGRGLGTGLREFKDGLSDVKSVATIESEKREHRY